MDLINRAEWESLKADPRDSKYRAYLALWLEELKTKWVDGEFTDPIENAIAIGKAQQLMDQINLNYDDIHSFFIAIGVKKENEQVNDE